MAVQTLIADYQTLLQGRVTRNTGQILALSFQGVPNTSSMDEFVNGGATSAPVLTYNVLPKGKVRYSLVVAPGQTNNINDGQLVIDPQQTGNGTEFFGEQTMRGINTIVPGSFFANNGSASLFLRVTEGKAVFSDAVLWFQRRILVQAA